MLELWPRVQSAIASDPAIESAVRALVSRMTLAQKIGQMVQAEIEAVTPAEVKQYHLGSVLNGGGSWPGKSRRAPVADWVALADAFYDASVDTEGSEGAYLPIPILWGTDAVHGHSNVRGATIFPHNIGLGAARDPGLIERIGAATAAEVAATGIDWTFAPTLAVVRDDRWGRAYESYGEDPAIVRDYAGPMVCGIQGHADQAGLLDHTRVLSCAKHYLGDGGTTDGVDQGDTAVDEAALVQLHAQGYVTALAAGAQTVMASFSSWNGDKMHGHRYLLTDVLRGPLGFDGFVVGDWNGHGQLPGCSNDQSAAAILAGVDMIMVPHDWRAFIENTISQVEDGTIPQARIDEAVTRILRVKMRVGLLGPRTDRGRPSSRQLAGQQALLGCDAHRALAREAVQKSLVLLKNTHGVLPLSPGQRVLVVGKGAHDVGIQSGGWTLTWQGTETSREDFPQATTVFEGIQAAVEAAGGCATLRVDGTDCAGDYDAIIAVIGETPYAEGQGDVRSAGIHHPTRHPEDLALLERVRARVPSVPLVTVLLTGRPIYCNAEMNRSDAVLVAWLPGGEGGGVADVVFGACPVTGVLPFSWPLEPEHTVLHPEDAERAAFSFGFGLRYGEAASDRTLPERGLAADAQAALEEVFTRGAVRPGWRLGLSDTASPAVVAASSEGRSGAGAVALSTVDGRLQGSARRVCWTAAGGLHIQSLAAHNRPPGPAPTVLHLTLRVVDAAPGVAVGCGGHDWSGALQQLSLHEWHTIALPIDALDALVLTADGGLTVDIEAIWLTAAAD